VGEGQLGAGRRAAVAAIPEYSVSRHCGDHPVRDLADDIVIRVADEQVAGGIQRDAE
jgi:hypothetical protein